LANGLKRTIIEHWNGTAWSVVVGSSSQRYLALDALCRDTIIPIHDRRRRRIRPGRAWVKVTPFHSRTRALNRFQMWFNWDLHIVPDVYTGFDEELRATREAVSMGDMSPLSKYEIRGPDAARLVDWVVTRDVTGIEVGQVLYTPWCDDRGKVVGDGLVFRVEANAFRLTADPQLEWLTGQAEGLDVTITDLTDSYGLLAIQGPRSPKVMHALTGGDWSDLPFSRTRLANVGEAEVMVARQGFTGELGFELWVPAASGPEVWDAVAEAGQPLGIRPVGEYAIDVARVEAGLLIVGADYTGAGPDRPGSVVELLPEHEASPYELNLGQFVDLDKNDFVGKNALAEERAAGLTGLHLTGLELDSRRIGELHASEGRLPLVPNRVWWYPLQIYRDGRLIGRATSVTWAPTIGKVVGFGHLDAASARPGTSVSVAWMMNGIRGDVPATVVDIPFLQLRRAE
jgi:aminomethyltransferase